MEHLELDQTGINKPISVFEKMLAAPNQKDHYLKVSQPFSDEDHSPELSESYFQEFMETYELVIQQIAKQWGNPEFEGDWETEGFPNWFDAIRMAYWKKGKALAFVAFQAGDKEVPMMLVQGVRSLG